MRDHELSDEQWAALAPHLPPQKPGTGRPANDHRTVVEGIPWRLRTGAPWRDLPERVRTWQSVYTRFRRWQAAGVGGRVVAALQAEADVKGELDWSLPFLDGTTIRAHLLRQGHPARGRRPSPRPLAGRLLHQAPPANRSRGQAAHLGPDAGAVP